MSEYTDDTIARHLAQQPGMRQALLEDPVQRAQTELMRRTLAAAERAMTDERVPDEVRRRVINRIVWGEPEGRIDVHAQMRDQVAAMYSSMLPSPEALRALLDGAGPARPDEEPT
jgi:hypothetical protein